MIAIDSKLIKLQALSSHSIRLEGSILFIKLSEMQGKMFVLWAVLLCTVLGLDFVLNATIRLNVAGVEQIFSAGDKLAVISPDSVFTLLNGSNYSNKVAQYQCNAEPSSIKVSSRGVVINSGSFLTTRDLSQSLYKFEESGYWSNMLLLNNSAFFSKADALPKLKVLNLTSMHMEEHAYEFKSESHGSMKRLSDAGENEIMFGFEEGLLVLDRQNLSLKQIVQMPHSIDQICYFSGPKSEKTAYVGLKMPKDLDIPEGLQWHKLTKVQGKYQTQPAFITPTQRPIQLNASSAGVILENGNIHYFQNLDSIALMGFNPNELIARRGRVLAVAFSERFFILEENLGNFRQYRIYSIGTDLRISFDRKVTVESKELFGRKAQFTLDDKNLFLSHRNESVNNLAIVDMEGLNYTLAKAQDGISTANNIIDFTLLSSGRPNDMYYVALAVSAADSSKLQFQLREGTSRIIIKYPATTIKSSNLLGNNFCGQYFLLVQNYNTQSSKISVFKGNNFTQIVNVQVSLQFTTQHTFYICGLCVVAWSPIEMKVKIYYLVNLSLLKTIPIQTQKLEVEINQNILIIHQEDLRKKSVYELTDIVYERGAFYVEYFNVEQYPIYVILPRLGLLYQAPGDHTPQSTSPTKVFYRIDKPALLKSVPVQIIQKIRIHPQYVNNGSSSWVLYTQFQLEWRLAKYTYSDQKVVSYPLRSATPISECKAFLSSDQRYVVVVYHLEHSLQSKVEVRPIDKLDTVVFDQLFAVTELSYLGSVNDADIFNNDTLVVHYFDLIFAAKLHKQLYAEKLGLSSINAFDYYQDYGRVAISGQFRDKFLVVKQQVMVVSASGQSVYLNQSVQSTAVLIAQSSSYLLTYHENFQLKSWYIYSNKLLNATFIPDITKIQLLQSDLFLIQFSSHFSLLNVTTFTFLEAGSLGSSDNSNYQAQAYNRSTFAQVTAQQQVFIKTSSFNGTFKTPNSNETIVSLRFANSYTLLVATDLGTLYILKPGNCSDNYVVQDLSCFCPSPFVENQGRCEDHSSSFPAWAIVLIIMSILVIIVAGVCWWQKRRLKSKMNSLLSASALN